MRRSCLAGTAEVHPIIMPVPGSWDSGMVHSSSRDSPASPTPAVSAGSCVRLPGLISDTDEAPPARVSSRMRPSSASYWAMERRASSSVS